ncbi:hypothetical protein D3C73_947210 [compost metagenome]
MAEVRAQGGQVATECQYGTETVRVIGVARAPELFKLSSEVGPCGVFGEGFVDVEPLAGHRASVGDVVRPLRKVSEQADNFALPATELFSTLGQGAGQAIQQVGGLAHVLLGE